MSVQVTDCSFAQGGEVSGSLSLRSSTVTVGVIASEWSEWLPALSFVPHSPVWVWILDKTWEKLSRRLFPSLLFINGFTEPLPPVDVLLLSKITLPQCSISLSSCLASLILSTSRLHSISSGWARRFWKFYHPNVGGAIDAFFTVFSLARIPNVVHPSFSTSLHLPAGTLRRVLSATTTGGRPCAPPLLSNHLDGLYSPCKTLPYFVVPSVFMKTGWSRRRLSLGEAFQLWDYSLSLFYKLSSQQRLRLFAWKCTPARVLGFCLRHFLASQSGSGGGGDSMNTTVSQCSVKTNCRTASTVFVDCQVNKRGKVSASYFDEVFDRKLIDYSKDKNAMCKVNLKYNSSSRKKDTAAVPIELWLYWLNAGTQVEITPEIWDKYVVVLQETFLLLRWRKNVLRCFGRWLSRRLSRMNFNHHTLSVIDVIVREQAPRVWV